MWRLYYLYSMWITWNWVSKCASENAISLILSLNSPKFFNLLESTSAKVTIPYWQYPAFWTIPEESKQWESSSKNEQFTVLKMNAFSSTTKISSNSVIIDPGSTYSTDCLSGWCQCQFGLDFSRTYVDLRIEHVGLPDFFRKMTSLRLPPDTVCWGWMMLCTRIFFSNIFK